MNALSLRFARSLCAVVLSSGALLAAQATLSHSAPFLGANLQLAIDGAPPGAHVRLFLSPNPASIATPWGTLEIDRNSVSIVGGGFADALGHWSITTQLPSAPAAAETPMHFQALVTPPSTGTAAQLSEAAHLRILGSRAYVACSGEAALPTGTANGGVAIVSLTNGELVATVDFGGVTEHIWDDFDAAPVFDASFSRGAVMTSPTDLLVFDPFFGGVIQHLAFASASRKLHTSADGSLLYVLDGVANAGQPGVHVIDFASLQPSGFAPLPAGSYGGDWVHLAAHSIAYVARSSSGVQTFVERVDLAAQQHTGAVLVGTPLTTFLGPMAIAGDLAVISSHDGFWPPGSGALTRVTETSNGPAAVVTPESKVEQLLALESSGTVALWTPSGFGPFGALRLQRLPMLTTTLYAGPPLGGLVELMAPSATGMWVISDNFGFVSGGLHLFHYDVFNAQWSDVLLNWWFDWPGAMAGVADSAGERVCVAADGVYTLDPLTIWMLPRLSLLDPATSALSEIDIGWRPHSMRVVAAP